MILKIKFFLVFFVLIIFCFSCSINDDLNIGINKNHYLNAYNYISNIKNIDIKNSKFDTILADDFRNSVFYVYDSLVYISTMKKSCDTIENHVPTYSHILDRIFSGQKDIYNINQRGKINWIIYFSKVKNECMFADVIYVSPLKFVWPESFSIKQKEEFYKKESIEAYKYNNLVNSIRLSIRYLFIFKFNNKGEIIDVKFEKIEY